jgi:hypothetical protein
MRHFYIITLIREKGVWKRETAFPMVSNESENASGVTTQELIDGITEGVLYDMRADGHRDATVIVWELPTISLKAAK